MTGIIHIVLARKPIEGTITENVLQHGTGALNVDGCRIGSFTNTLPSGVDRRNAKLAELGYRPGNYQMGETIPNGAPGRFPANLILDTSNEVQDGFPDCGISSGGSRGKGGKHGRYCPIDAQPEIGKLGFNDSGSASRFFFNFTEQEIDE